MTAERVRAIQTRLDAATPGPWKVRHEPSPSGDTTPHDVYSYQLGRFRDEWRRVCSADGSIQGQDDAALIAHAPDDLAFLLAELAAATERAEQAEAVIAAADHWRKAWEATGRCHDEFGWNEIGMSACAKWQEAEDSAAAALIEALAAAGRKDAS